MLVNESIFYDEEEFKMAKNDYNKMIKKQYEIIRNNTKLCDDVHNHILTFLYL